MDGRPEMNQSRIEDLFWFLSSRDILKRAKKDFKFSIFKIDLDLFYSHFLLKIYESEGVDAEIFASQLVCVHHTCTSSVADGIRTKYSTVGYLIWYTYAHQMWWRFATKRGSQTREEHDVRY
jgi:hypothetical protein